MALKHLSCTLTALGKFSGFHFWSTVTQMHVDSNSLPLKNRSSTTSFPTQLTKFFLRVVCFLERVTNK